MFSGISLRIFPGILSEVSRGIPLDIFPGTTHRIYLEIPLDFPARIALVISPGFSSVISLGFSPSVFLGIFLRIPSATPSKSFPGILMDIS